MFSTFGAARAGLNRPALVYSGTLEGDWPANLDDFGKLVESFQDRMVGYAFRRLGNVHEAEEAAQEVFLRAYRRLDTFDLARSFGTWIGTIAANVSRDRLRRRARGEPRAVPEFPGRAGDAPDPAAEASRLEEADREARARGRADPKIPET